MIDFDTPAQIERQVQLITMLGEQVMRPIARYYDDHESERPWDYINMIWQTVRAQGGRTLAAPSIEEKPGGNGEKKPRFHNLLLMHTVEALSWGDAGLYLSTPGGALGGAAVEATGTPEQKERFLKRFTEGEPKWAAMAMTEPHAGSDTAAIRTTARLSDDGKEWIINGEKIFVTGGLMSAKESRGFVVVWATIDASAGRAAMKPFVVESGTPGMTVAKLEHKHGIRASDTAALVFQDCHIPVDNLLGSAEVARPNEGHTGGRSAASKCATVSRCTSRPRSSATCSRWRPSTARPGCWCSRLPRSWTPARKIRSKPPCAKSRPVRWPTSWRKRQSSYSGRTATHASCLWKNGCATRASTISTKAPARSTAWSSRGACLGIAAGSFGKG